MALEAQIQIAIGNKIRETRRSRQMTQRELARKLQFDFSYMCKIEGGKFYVEVKTLCEIAQMLGVHPCTFYPTEQDLQQANPFKGVPGW